MARIRSIKPEFFESEDVAALPLRARLTWIGLWVHCDNYGRTKDNLKLVKKNVWPLDRISLSDVEEDLKTLAAHGRIVRYEVDGKPYLAIINWTRHQPVPRPGLPKYPAPPPEVPNVARHDSDASVNSHVRDSDESMGNREQGTGNRERQSAAADDVAFNEFWSVYPRKVGKKDARNSWTRAIKDAEPQRIIAAAKLYADHIAASRTETRFIANPATWLNQGRWDDDLPTQQSIGDTSPMWRPGVRRDD